MALITKQHTLCALDGDEALPFSVWRETRVIPRRRLAAFRLASDAILFAEMRADNADETVDTTIWMTGSDGTETLYGTHPARRI